MALPKSGYLLKYCLNQEHFLKVDKKIALNSSPGHFKNGPLVSPLLTPRLFFVNTRTPLVDWCGHDEKEQITDKVMDPERVKLSQTRSEVVVSVNLMAKP